MSPYLLIKIRADHSEFEMLGTQHWWLMKHDGRISRTAKLRIWTLRIWSFSGPRFRSARHVLCGDASRLFLDHFSEHLSSVLERTELCREVWSLGPQTPPIIRNENHHLALFDHCFLDWHRVSSCAVSMSAA